MLLLAAVFSVAACQSADPFSAATDTAAADTAAQTVKVITSGGFAAAYSVLAPEYQNSRAVELETAYGSSSGGSVSSIPSRLGRGETADIIILSRSSLDNLTRLGYVVADTRVDLVHSQIGMAVREGAAKPDISTPEAFAAALRQAKSIGYSASVSGTYLSATLWPKIGIWPEIRAKSRRIVGERVAAVVARGELEVGFQQISEILPIAGADYAGPIPAEYQKTTVFAAGILKTAANPQGARRLLTYLSSKAVAATIAETGLIPVALLNTE